MEIYLDNAATTRVCEESAKAVFDAMTKDYGNPSSVHNLGFKAEMLVRNSKETIAKGLGCDYKDIIFTSGGTEANNLAIIGGINANKRVGNHIITTEIEHPSVLSPIKYLESIGYDVTYIPCNNKGQIILDDLKDAIQRDTVLVSVMAVNNEIGTIQPIQEVGDIISRTSDNCIFHVDCIQAFGKIPISLKRSRIDFLTASAHKIHGPKGVGFLYKKSNTKLSPLVYGGGQFDGLRNGTENVPGIAGFGACASKALSNLESNFNNINELRKYFINEVSKINDVFLNGYEEEYASPYIASITIKGIQSEVLIHALEEKNIYVSSKSACSTHSKHDNSTLKAIGLSKELRDSTIRFSFCRETNKNELINVINELRDLIPKLRRFKRM